MTTYATVSAVHIQGWLTRTPQLQLLRGASMALKHETSRERVTQKFPALRWCDQAGDVDGVICVELDDADEASRWVARLVGHLQHELPAIDVEAWWAQADDYVGAFDRMLRDNDQGQVDPGVHRLVSLPALSDLPILESCHGCRLEPVDMTSAAVRLGDEESDEMRLGLDCRARYQFRDRSGMAAMLGLPEEATLARDFETLASIGAGIVGGRHTRADNHLATVTADGNGIGDLMRRLARPGHDVSRLGSAALADVRSNVIRMLDQATRQAVAEANYAISDGGTIAPSLPHFVGGDDVFVTVAAPRVWEFVVALASSFEVAFRNPLIERVAALRASDGMGDGDRAALDSIGRVLDRVSLGIGVTIAHASHPLVETHAHAFGRMKEAKRGVRGRAAAVSWIDASYEEPSIASRCLRVDTLSEWLVPGGAPSAMLLTPSARATLGNILRGRGSDDDRARYGRVTAWVKRTARDGRASLALPAGDQLTAARCAEELQVLADQVSLARWWPTAGSE